MKFTKLIRNKKAISPIFATLILIAIAVIAGIVVYMFTSGTIASMTGSGTAGQEKAAIQGVTYTIVDAGTTDDTIKVYASCVAGGPIELTGALVKDSEGNTVATAATLDDNDATTTGTELTADGTLRTISLTLTNDVSDYTETYTVTLTSADGGSFVSSAFVP